VSSTTVRDLLSATRDDRRGNPELTRLVPRRVLDYIEEHGLYG
jgi:hypothetical protein